MCACNCWGSFLFIYAYVLFRGGHKLMGLSFLLFLSSCLVLSASVCAFFWKLKPALPLHGDPCEKFFYFYITIALKTCFALHANHNETCFDLHENVFCLCMIINMKYVCFCNKQFEKWLYICIINTLKTCFAYKY